MMNQDGIKVHPIQGRRTRGAPWSRLYSKRVWRNLRFPEDYWFEDTIQMFCIDTQYTERYIDKHLYRYRVNHGGISANASAMCFVKFLWAVSAFLLVRLSGCF